VDGCLILQTWLPQSLGAFGWVNFEFGKSGVFNSTWPKSLPPNPLGADL
jgi:hypothetical protein